MSYKFSLDHTLAIADIHDMITIDIEPKTRCTVTGGDVEIHGYLTFDGSYLTPELGEESFEGRIPLDITLPYLDGSSDVRPEVVSFDYRVENKESLTLTIEVALNGYNVGQAHEKSEDTWARPIVEEPVYEDAVIEPFDLPTTVPTKDSAIEPKNPYPISENTVVLNEDTCEDYCEDVLGLPENVCEHICEKELGLDDDYCENILGLDDDICEKNVVVEKNKLVEKAKKAKKELIKTVDMVPYSPLVSTREDDTCIEEIKFENLDPVAEEGTVEETVPVEEEISERIPLRVTDSEATLMEELFEVERKMDDLEKEQILEEVALDSEVMRTVVDIEDAIMVEEEKPVVVADSVARQFADGETTIKMVYVGHESETLGGVLERYSATLDDVWNLSALAGGVAVGDCVMLRYEKSV